VIHRGFYYEKTKYRNIPEWQIELQNKFDLPLIIDPHITGDRK
jgi:chorismate mutase